MRKPGILPQVSWNLIPTCPESLRTNVNKSRKVQEAKLTDFENQMEQAEFAAGHLIDVKIAVDSLLLKRKQQDDGVKNVKKIKCTECIIPLSCRRQFFDRSP